MGRHYIDDREKPLILGSHTDGGGDEVCCWEVHLREGAVRGRIPTTSGSSGPQCSECPEHLTKGPVWCLLNAQDFRWTCCFILYRGYHYNGNNSIRREWHAQELTLTELVAESCLIKSLKLCGPRDPMPFSAVCLKGFL